MIKASEYIYPREVSSKMLLSAFSSRRADISQN